MNSILKPCPFCGGEAVLKYHKGLKCVNPINGEDDRVKTITKGYWLIGCKTPDCILGYDEYKNSARLMFTSGSKQFAAERWNRRADDGKTT